MSPTERIWQPGDLVERPAPDLSRGRRAPPSFPGSQFGLQQGSHPVSAPRTVAQAGGRRGDPPVAALGARPQALAPGQFPALGARLPLQLHDVQGEIDDGSVADGGPDPVGVGISIELQDVVLVDPARDEEPDPGEATFVELPPYLPQDRGEIPATACRRVESYFSITRMAREHAALYERVCARDLAPGWW